MIEKHPFYLDDDKYDDLLRMMADDPDAALCNFDRIADEGERVTFYLYYREACLVSAIKIVSYEGEYVVGTAYTRQSERRKGYFSKLADTVKNDFDTMIEFPVYTACGIACCEAIELEKGEAQYHLCLPKESILAQNNSCAAVTIEFLPIECTSLDLDMPHLSDLDLERLSRIHSQCFLYEKAISTLYIRDTICECNAKPFIIKTGPDQQAEELGCGFLLIDDATTWLCGFGILPDYRKKHFAKSAIYEIMKQLQYPVTQLNVQVSDANEAALHLYQKVGFTTKICCYSYFL